MSYDLFLSPPPPAGGDLLAAARAAMDGESPHAGTAFDWPDRIRARASALMAAEPLLRTEAFGDDPDDARAELNLPPESEADTGLQPLRLIAATARK